MSNRDWEGIRVQKGDRYGTVVADYNSFLRILRIKMDDGGLEQITMSNTGPDPDPEELHKWEWYWDRSDNKAWYRF